MHPQFVPDAPLGKSLLAPNPPEPVQVAATVAYLQARGFTPTRHYANDGTQWFTRNDGDTHTVVVWPDGQWDYSVEGLHSGFSFEELTACIV